jgi:hypothetical protein
MLKSAEYEFQNGLHGGILSVRVGGGGGAGRERETEYIPEPAIPGAK